MKVLVTGFDPFGGESINPAWEAVSGLPARIADAEIVTLQIPVVVGASLYRLHEKIRELAPDLVISVGQAGGRYCVTPERVAINVIDARIPDNDGNQPIDEPIFADGETAYFSNLPVKQMVKAIQEAGYPARLSNTAGTYLCNYVMYGILYYIQKEFPQMQGGFIHVPYTVSQVLDKPDTPAMSIPDIRASLTAAIAAAVQAKAQGENGEKLAGGSIC